jgi:hypothetical protein
MNVAYHVIESMTENESSWRVHIIFDRELRFAHGPRNSFSSGNFSYPFPQFILYVSVLDKSRHVELYQFVSCYFCKSGQVWTSLDKSGQVWNPHYNYCCISIEMRSLAGLCRIIILMIKYKIWIKFDQIRSNSIKFDQIGSDWFRLDQVGLNGSIWFNLDQTWSNWIKLDQIRSYSIKLDQIGSNWFNLDQIGINWIKFDNDW